MLKQQSTDKFLSCWVPIDTSSYHSHVCFHHNARLQGMEAMVANDICGYAVALGDVRFFDERFFAERFQTCDETFRAIRTVLLDSGGVDILLYCLAFGTTRITIYGYCNSNKRLSSKISKLSINTKYR